MTGLFQPFRPLLCFLGSNQLYFSYDAFGTPQAVVYNGTQYRYITNLQGDIVEIRDANDSTVVRYTYDAWGKLLTTTGTKANTLGTHNPLRYRGYVYDTETGLYYLQSRYYNPTMGRFICSDIAVATGQGILGNNAFAYCSNNPVLMSDSSGQFGLVASMIIGGLLGAASQFISGVVSNIVEGKTGTDIFANTGTVGEYTTAILTGALCAIPGASALVSVVCDVAAPALEQGIDYCVYGDEWSWEEYSADALTNLACDAVSSFASTNSPEFIRDIKQEAKALNKKGTKELTKFLTQAQNQAFIGNQLIGISTGIAKEVYVGAARKLAYAF